MILAYDMIHIHILAITKLLNIEISVILSDTFGYMFIYIHNMEQST